ncbi:MAG TPA: DUF2007 domain-containing protein [Candidatus Thioglobus sp.]|jgi:hypothetical protein|nr:DUF2007 domain-containing protein [Candidatus Thioglobus sp.]
MKLIYTNENRIMVLNVKNVLIGHGFEVALNNEFASGAAGSLAPFWPEVWLLKDDNLEEALKIVESFDTDISSITWQCSQCLEDNDQTFDYCWNCNAENSQ